MGPFIFQSALWGASALEVPFLTPVVTRLPLGLGVAPKCLILDAFLEVFHLGNSLYFLGLGSGSGSQHLGQPPREVFNLAGTLSSSTSTSFSLSLLARKLRIGLVRVASPDPHEDIRSGD